MSQNININEKCVKGNTTYFKIKITDMIKNEINKVGVNKEAYQEFDYKISKNFKKFTDKVILGGDFSAAITNLRDETLTECAETDKNSSSTMRPFFKDYVFDKIYSMGINIKKGELPDDFEQELEDARLQIEEENDLKDEEELQKENEKNESEISITIEDEAEEKPLDLGDQMWNYFFGGSSSKAETKLVKQKETNKKENKDKIKGE